jgi:hypothetical protein
MKTDVEYEVTFTLEGDERFIVRGRGAGPSYFRVETIVVTLRPEKNRNRCSVSGRCCKKDGGEHAIRRNEWQHVDLPLEELGRWIAKAYRVVGLVPAAIGA